MSSNLTGGTDDIYTSERARLSGLCVSHLIRDPLRHLGHVRNVPGWQRDGYLDMIVVQQSYFEPEHFEESPQQLRRRGGQFEGKQGQGVEQGCLVRAGQLRLARGIGVQSLDLCGDRFLLRLQAVVRGSQAAGERIVRVPTLGLQENRLLALLDVSDGAFQRGTLPQPLFRSHFVRRRGLAEQQPYPLLPEHPIGQELDDRFGNRILADVDRLAVSRVLVRPPPVVVQRVADVVGEPRPLRPEHATTATAEDQASEQACPLRLWVAVELETGPPSPADLPAGVHLVVHPLRNQRFVRWLDRPDPLLRSVDLPVRRPRRPPIEDLIARVLRIVDDVSDGGLAPGPTRAKHPRRLRRRVPRQIGVEPINDLRVSEALVPPERDLSDRLAAKAVRLKPGLRESFRRLRGVGMAIGFGTVAVAGLADVPTLANMGAQAAPGLFQRVEHFVLGD
nr:hypothetical protein [Amycolatopsis benzoatilytica]